MISQSSFKLRTGFSAVEQAVRILKLDCKLVQTEYSRTLISSKRNKRDLRGLTSKFGRARPAGCREDSPEFKPRGRVDPQLL